MDRDDALNKALSRIENAVPETMRSDEVWLALEQLYDTAFRDGRNY